MSQPIYISDFKQILEDTERSQSDFVGILHLSSEDFNYIIFYEPDGQKMLGYLKHLTKAV
jgi:hypothetical protein